jgi:CRP-like cAMP-binding protein
MAEFSRRPSGPRPKKSGGSAEFPAGATLFDSHLPCRRVYLLRSGRVRLTGDRGAVLDYLSEGDFFGLKSLLTSYPGGLSAKCLSPVKLSSFSKSELLGLLQRDRRFAARLLRNLARRVDRYEQTIQDAVLERAERRLALLLARLAPSRPASGWVPLRFNPSNAEFARTIGSTRWRIAHFMHHFQSLGWLQRRPKLWVLREGLRQFLEPSPEIRPHKFNVT